MTDDPIFESIADSNRRALREEYSDDTRVRDALEDLLGLLREHVGTRPLTRSSIDRCLDIVKDHYEWCRRQNIDFPSLTTVVLPSAHMIRLHPRELSQDAKEMIVVNLIREFGYGQNRPMEELAWAVAAAWPSFKARGPIERKLGVK